MTYVPMHIEKICKRARSLEHLEYQRHTFCIWCFCYLICSVSTQVSWSGTTYHDLWNTVRIVLHFHNTSGTCFLYIPPYCFWDWLVASELSHAIHAWHSCGPLLNEGPWCHISDLGPHPDPSISEHFPDSTRTLHYLCVNVYSLSLSFILLLYDFLSSRHYSIILSSIDYLRTLRPLHTIPLDTIIIWQGNLPTISSSFIHQSLLRL